MIDSSALDPSEKDALPGGFFEDPYPFYAAVAKEDGWRRFAGRVWVAGYELCRQLLLDDRLSSDRRTAGAAREVVSPPEASGNLLFMDGPAHARLHKVVSEALATTAGDTPFDTMVADTWHDVARGASDGDRMDFLVSIAQPVTAGIVGRLLGLEDEEIATLLPLLRQVTATIEPFEEPRERAEGSRASFRLLRYFEDNYSRLVPRSATLRRLQQASLSGEMTELETLVTPAVLLHAGFENSANFLAGVVLHEMRERTRGAERHPVDVDELLRRISPAQTVARVAREPISVRSLHMQRHEHVYIALAAANLDPSVFGPGPRRHPRHLAFGHGPHYCLGASLARTEMRILVPQVRDLLREWSLEQEPEWRRRVGFRSPRSLVLSRV